MLVGELWDCSLYAAVVVGILLLERVQGRVHLLVGKLVSLYGIAISALSSQVPELVHAGVLKTSKVSA
jgi:hypothetical protein